jgi:hypothetical protein
MIVIEPHEMYRLAILYPSHPVSELTVYRLTDKASCDAALGSPEYTEMVADYDRAFRSVLRTRDVVTLVDERNI